MSHTKMGAQVSNVETDSGKYESDEENSENLKEKSDEVDRINVSVSNENLTSEYSDSLLDLKSSRTDNSDSDLCYQSTTSSIDDAEKTLCDEDNLQQQSVDILEKNIYDKNDNILEMKLDAQDRTCKVSDCELSKDSLKVEKYPTLSEDLLTNITQNNLEIDVENTSRKSSIATENSDNFDRNDDSDVNFERSVRRQRRISTLSCGYNVNEEEESEDECITDFLDKCTNQAEARLAARRQARAEAREIRMRELERQQKEQEENADRQYDMLAEPITRTTRTSGIGSRSASTGLNNSSYLSSRRSSEDSLEDGGSLRDVRLELKELEDKFRKAMIANAQLDNEKSAQTYQLELLKDRIEELEEELSQLRREHRETCRENDQMKRLTTRLKEEFTACKAELEERDRLIMEKGLVIVGETVSEEEGDGSTSRTPKKALVSIENAELLENAGEGSLDVRLKKFAEEKRELMDQLSHLRLELEEERSRKKRRTSTITSNASLQNGPSLESDALDVIDIQREANKQLADYKFRLQKSEQDIATLQATVARLESQVIRYKSAAEASEKAEDELKVEKRKLQREVKESQSRIEELETSNNHLQRRLEKLKNVKSALLKEL